MNLNPEYFPQHRDLFQIKSDLNKAEEKLSSCEDESELPKLTKAVLELKVEYAEADHFHMSMSMMFCDRVGENYFDLMRKLRGKHSKRVEARHELIKYENSLK